MAFIKFNNKIDSLKLVIVTLFADKKPFNFVIDTGSNISHISIPSAKKLPNAVSVAAQDKQVGGISGSVNATGKIKQTFVNDVFKFTHEFFVTNLDSLVEDIYECSGIKVDGILGTDFLIKYRCHLDFKKNRLHLG